jgi:thioredoxin reductase (NADPH)
MYDLVIIGSGPAGLAAAIYATRAELNTITVEKGFMSGGQVLLTETVDNYPGIPNVNGFDLGQKLRDHADSLGAVFAEEEIQSIERKDGYFVLHGLSTDYETKTIIAATGAQHRHLGVEGEERLAGRGVSYCATCDGALYKGKTVAVVGGGNVAVEDALFLSRMCAKVYLIHRRNELRAVKSLQTQAFKTENIELVWDSVLDEITGENDVTGAKIKNIKTGVTTELALDGVFVAVGITPDSRVFEGLADMEDGFIKAGEDGATSVPGLYAAGDVRTKAMRQIITAAADGANCVHSVDEYLRTL